MPTKDVHDMPSTDGAILREAGVIAGLRRSLASKQATIDALMLGFQTTQFPSVPGLAFDVSYRPAAVLERLGGDWYDVFLIPDGRVAFTIGDVCGRGLAAAVKMGQAKQAVKSAASLKANDPMPRAVLTQTNTVIFLNDHEVQLTTAIYGIIDTKARSVTYASAGHNPPVLAETGTAPAVLPNHGFPLGVEMTLPDLIREHEFAYASNSMLVLYTDGLIEFGHDAAEGERRLLDASCEAVERRVSNPAKFIVERVVNREPLHRDDIAVLTIWFE